MLLLLIQSMVIVQGLRVAMINFFMHGYSIKWTNLKILFFGAICVFSSQILAKEIHILNHQAICKEEYTRGAILRKDPAFVDDFLILHSLLTMLNPISVFEIGTCTGEGTLIIKNAIGNNTVYSLDLPLKESTYDIQIVGKMCTLPYVQITGNSMNLNYSDFYPIDSWFIDGAHEYSYVLHETKQALLSHPKIIIWHDVDIPEVLQAICDGLDEDDNYALFRVSSTRIAFAVPLTSRIMEIIQ